jgi:hypothetical protein
MKHSVLILAILLTALTMPVTANTWGYTAVGASTDSWTTQNALCYNFTAPADLGTLLSINFYTKLGSGTSDMKGAIWEDNNLTLIQNSVTTAWTADTTYAWKYGNFTAQPTLVAGQNYCIGIISDDAGSFYNKYDAGTTGFNIAGIASYASPGSITSSVNRDRKISVYIEYLPAAGESSNIIQVIMNYIGTMLGRGPQVMVVTP